MAREISERKSPALAALLHFGGFLVFFLVSFWHFYGFCIENANWQARKAVKAFWAALVFLLLLFYTHYLVLMMGRRAIVFRFSLLEDLSSFRWAGMKDGLRLFEMKTPTGRTFYFTFVRLLLSPRYVHVWPWLAGQECCNNTTFGKFSCNVRLPSCPYVVAACMLLDCSVKQLNS
jgi:hypothetical protein